MHHSRAIVLVLIVQIVCAVFFLSEMLNTVFGFVPWSISWTFYEILEIIAAIGLITGVILGAQALKLSWQRAQAAERKLETLSQAFADLVLDYFESWELTAAERDVALFLIKGLSTAEIAGLRSTSEGTVKAQCNAIYRKADVASRAQLVSLLIDDLMQDEFFGAMTPRNVQSTTQITRSVHPE